MKAIILAGGLGTRLKPFTQIIPKPLLPVGESSVLEIQILSLKKHGVTDIFIATNYMADYVKAFLGDGSKYGVRLVFSDEPTDHPFGVPSGRARLDRRHELHKAQNHAQSYPSPHIPLPRYREDYR